MGRIRGASRSLRYKFQNIRSQRPATTSFRIVFPYEYNDYSRAQFQPFLTQNRASLQEVEAVFDLLRTSPSYYVDYSSTCDFEDITFWILCILLIIIIPIIGCILAIFLIIGRDAKKEETFLARLELRRQELSRLLQTVNLQWNDKQIRWSMGRSGAWIQMDLLYMMNGAFMYNGPVLRVSNGYGGPVVGNHGYMAPVNQGGPLPPVMEIQMPTRRGGGNGAGSNNQNNGLGIKEVMGVKGEGLRSMEGMVAWGWLEEALGVRMGIITLIFKFSV